MKQNDLLISIGNRMNAIEIYYIVRIYKVIYDNSLKIARAFRRVQFERIFKYHE